MVVRGVTARLTWGYHPAGELRDWSITKADAGGYALAATVVQIDAFRASQRPLTLVVPHATGAWRWPIRALEIAAGALSARLGPKE